MHSIFLGGVVGHNNWRKDFISALVSAGVERSSIYNPKTEHWNLGARKEEEIIKSKSDYCVFYIGDTKEPENSLPSYSPVEATISLYEKEPQTVIIFDREKLHGHPLEVLNQMSDMLKNRFPKAHIFSTQKEAVDFLISRKK